MAIHVIDHARSFQLPQPSGEEAAREAGQLVAKQFGPEGLDHEVVVVDRDGWHRADRPPSSEQLAAAWGPFFRFCIDAFGPQRCMFESNFPVDRESCSYTVLWNAFKRIAAGAGASDSDKTELFSGTARRVYGLDRTTPEVPA